MDACARVRAFSMDLLEMLMSAPAVSFAVSVTSALQSCSTTATAKKPPKLKPPSGAGGAGTVTLPALPVPPITVSISLGGSSWEMVVTLEYASAIRLMLPPAVISPSAIVCTSINTRLIARDRGIMPMVATAEVVTSPLLLRLVLLPEMIVPVSLRFVRESAVTITTDTGKRNL